MSKLCKRILLILAVFSSFLTLFACSAIQIDTYHVELPQDKYQLRVGQEIEALPIVSKNGQECDLEVLYHSYDASIATYVDGKIVALKSGEVRIKVTLKNNSKVYATALVTVVNDDSLIVDFNYEKTMIKGTTQLLTYELLVEKNRKLTFTSSDENVATIDELGNIKAITVGTTTIETVVSSLYDEGVSKTYKLVIEVKDLTFAINYVLDGGTNSENNPNEYVPEKLPLLLENPTKSGYKFVGWYDNENFTGEAITEISAGTMGEVTLYAKWNALDYRISYELNGGTNAENPDGYDVSDLPVSLHAPSRTGYIFKGWYMGENRVLAIPVGTTGNVVVFAKWEPITYTIHFDTNGGLPTLSSIDYTIESDSFTLQEITKVGYTFDGWYNGETKVTEITTGTYGNMTLVAKWTADLYTISYDLADGVNNPENPTSYTIESGLITLKDPTRVGYTFGGWYNGEQLVTSIDSNSLENISLTAKWTINSYTLTFDVDGVLTEKVFKYGETVVAIADPTKVGYTFNGWTPVVPTTMPAEDVIVIATWKLATVHAGTEDDPYSVEDALLVAGTLSTGDSTSDNYYVRGVVSKITEISTSYGNATFEITVNGKTILVFRAKNEGNQKFTNTDDLYIGDEVVIFGKITNFKGTLGITDGYVFSNVKVERPQPITEPDVVEKTIKEIIDMDDDTNKKASYKVTVIVLGWGKELTSYDSNPNEYGNMIVSDIEGLNKIVVYGATASSSALVWDSTNGKYTYVNKKDFLTNAITKEINIGDTLELIVIRDTYSGNVQLNAVITKVTPKAIVNSNITFDANGNVILKMSSADYSVRFNSADRDMRFRYYKSGQQSISLYKYSTSTSEPSTSHKINYANLPEGTTNSNPTSYTEGETITLVDPVLPGCTFEGWYDNAECTGTKITEISGYTTDITLYAKFAKIPTHSISYKYNVDSTDITNDNPAEYAEGDSTVLKDAKLTNYAFSGWYLDSEYTNKITAIDHSWTTDIVIFGKFETSTEKIIVSTFKDINLSTNETIDLTWKLSVDANSFETASLARGVQIGAAKGTVQLSAANSKYKVNRIVMIVSTNGTANKNSIALTVGEQSASTISLKKANNYEIEFVLETATLGDILFTINDANKSVYIKSITIYYM